MTAIVLDDKQVETLAQASGRVELRDPRGNLLAYVDHGVTEEEIAIALARLQSDEPRYSTSEVLRHLESLERK